MSNDGQWFGYRLAPGEGDAQVVLKRVQGDKELKFDIGDPQAASAGAPAPPPGPPAGAPPATLDFSEDSKWVAFTTYPTHRDAQRLRRLRRPLQNGVTIVNLATGEKHEYAKIRQFAFSGEAATWIALQRYPPQTTPPGAPGQAGGQGAGPAAAGAAGAANDRPRGTDLILRELATNQELNIGNVADFSFSRDGRALAWTIDAQDKVGNGVQVRDMTRGTVAVLDSGSASVPSGPPGPRKGTASAC